MKFEARQNGWSSLASILAMAVWMMGCGGSVFTGGGDAQAITAFHATLIPGALLTDAIVAGEKAQRLDIRYQVWARGASGGDLEVGRYWQEPYIRITKPIQKGDKVNRAYQEMGYASRDDFSRGVKEALPAFYGCENFRFVFNRFQGGLNSDYFEVKVDAKGFITSISRISPHPYD